MPARGRGYYFSGGESCSQNTQVLFSKNISERFSESNIKHYYSTIMSFYHIRSREQAEYEAVIHCSVLV